MGSWGGPSTVSTLGGDGLLSTRQRNRVQLIQSPLFRLLRPRHLAILEHLLGSPVFSGVFGCLLVSISHLGHWALGGMFLHGGDYELDFAHCSSKGRKDYLGQGSIMAGKAWRYVREAAGHIVSTSQSRKSLQSRTPAHDCPVFRCVFPPQLTDSGNFLTGMPRPVSPVNLVDIDHHTC